jgi:hypothetical protein
MCSWSRASSGCAGSSRLANEGTASRGVSGRLRGGGEGENEVRGCQRSVRACEIEPHDGRGRGVEVDKRWVDRWVDRRKGEVNR